MSPLPRIREGVMTVSLSRGTPRHSHPDLECLRCGRRWKQRGRKVPRTCAKCKSPYWRLARGILPRGPKPCKA